MKNRLPLRVILIILPLCSWTFTIIPRAITWKLTNPNQVGGYQTIVTGSPRVNIEGKDTSLFFNGISDGLVIPAIPIKGWQQFTIEIKFKPAGDGPVAPRFIHFEDSLLNRGTIELRLNADRQWYLDAFLKSGKTNKGLALIDSTKLHPADKWYWAAMVYDGKKNVQLCKRTKRAGRSI